MQPRFSDLSSLQSMLRQGDITVVEVVQYYLTQIEASQSLNAYLEAFEEEALAKAQALDTQLKAASDTLPPLFGLVVSIKDVICYKGHKVSGASAILEGFESLFSATAVEKLLEAGAIIIGRTNCDEFAMGSANENSAYGAVGNGYDEKLVPGGSSGGAAVAVQMDTCMIALGSDTGGSVRQPAAFCGVIGLKPTYGRVSRHGLLAYASSFDQIGVLGHDMTTIAQVLEVISGSDEFDATVSDRAVPSAAALLATPTLKRIAYFPQAIDHPGIDPVIRAATRAHMAELTARGHEFEAVDFEFLDYIIPAYYVLTTAEASSNLSRYDGIRYGHRSKDATTLDATYRRSRTEGFGAEVKKRIMLGTFVLSAGYYDAYYSQAQKVRRLMSDRMHAIFQAYDLLMMPVSPVFPWERGSKNANPVEVYLADIFTVLANMTGAPALAWPLPVEEGHLPIGIQYMAPHFEEERLLAFAK